MKKLSYILFFFILLLVFLVLYVFPSMKTVNKIKRDIKDYKLKIEDIKRERSVFTMFDKREATLILRIKKDLRRKVPVVKDKKSLLQLKEDALAHIMKLAGNLNIPGIKAASAPGKGLKTDAILSLPGVNDLRALDLSLSFPADLKSGLEFINNISWWEKSIFTNKISIVPDTNRLFFTMVVKCFYFDNINQEKEQRQDGETGPVDLNSPLLEEKIYNNLPERPVKKKLPEIYGRSVFR